MKPCDLFYYFRVAVLAFVLLAAMASVNAQGKNKTFPLGVQTNQAELALCLTKEDAIEVAQANSTDMKLGTALLYSKMMQKKCYVVQQVVVTYHKLEWRAEKPDADGDTWSVYSATSGEVSFYEITDWKHQVVET